PKRSPESAGTTLTVRTGGLEAADENQLQSRFEAMYAVIKTGGKQYRVAAGEKFRVEQIPADIGSEVVLDKVLLVGSGDAVTVGKPLVAGATVTTKVVS